MLILRRCISKFGCVYLCSLLLCWSFRCVVNFIREIIHFKSEYVWKLFQSRTIHVWYIHLKQWYLVFQTHPFFSANLVAVYQGYEPLSGQWRQLPDMRQACVGMVILLPSHPIGKAKVFLPTSIFQGQPGKNFRGVRDYTTQFLPYGSGTWLYLKGVLLLEGPIFHFHVYERKGKRWRNSFFQLRQKINI